MSTTATDLWSLRKTNSRTTTSSVGIGHASAWKVYCTIPESLEIRVTDPDATGTVIQLFVVEIKHTGEEFLATSHISNSYEFGETIGQALKNYLAILVDELIWLEKHQVELSPSIQEDLHLLQNYIRVV
ncbi:MAG TPA: hypothetical protein VNE61_04230 [Ktedonobacteraceae bacterium]|nr:hypothetical protein [Ktedonobacteraceae bacterium]